MSEKKSLTKVFAEKYKYASKLENVLILNEFIYYTQYNRSYAARVLRANNSNSEKTQLVKNLQHTIMTKYNVPWKSFEKLTITFVESDS